LKEKFSVIIIRGEDVLLVDASGYNAIDFGIAFDAGGSCHIDFY
jgi:hypothetical protein